MYQYITENNLLNKQKYNYSEYRGEKFLKDYLESRVRAIELLSETREIRGSFNNNTGGGGVKKDLFDLLNDPKMENKKKLDIWVKSFEVRKRLYTAYNENMKPVKISETTYSDFDAYILFAKVLLAAHKRYKVLKYFSCLLKLNDTLISVKDRLTDTQKLYLREVLVEELSCYDELVTHIFAEENT